MNNYELISGGAELLDQIEPLWKKLIQHHAAVNPTFAGHLAEKNFENRKKELIGKSANKGLRVELALDKDSKEYSGYCVSTISGTDTGEVDSIFVEENQRGCGIGEKLIASALKWMDDEKVKEKRVEVITGNERAFKFYKRFGFHQRKVTLIQIA